MALTDSLISYWKLDEASGNALDAHGSNNLTETGGTIDATTGKISGCRDFEAGDTEQFQIADNTDLSTGDIDFTIACWVNAESLGADRDIITKDDGVSQREYNLTYQTSSSRFRFIVWTASGGIGLAQTLANNLGAPSTATWYYIVAWHDSVANTINIQVNNGTVDSVSHSGGVYNGTAAFWMGARSNSTNYWDGLIDEVGFWKRVLTTDERTSLYNGGSGFAYPFSTLAGRLIGGRLVGGHLTRSRLVGN